jgi:hypothetical protein
VNNGQVSNNGWLSAQTVLMIQMILTNHSLLKVPLTDRIRFLNGIYWFTQFNSHSIEVIDIDVKSFYRFRDPLILNHIRVCCLNLCSKL